MKVCSKCKKALPLNLFYKRKNKPLSTICNLCNNERQRAYYRADVAKGITRSMDRYRANPESYKDAMLKSRLKNRYGITVEAYNLLAAEQHYICACCSKPFAEFKKRPQVDHCHKTGAIRGLLCPSCNLGIGMFGDGVEGLIEAVDYLQKFNRKLTDLHSQDAKSITTETQMQIQRLDNRRLLTPGEEETTPVVSVTKSYARLNPAATALLDAIPGKDCIGFGWDADSQSFVFYKAPDEKSGKKLSEAGTLNSESIYKRLVEGASYTFGTPVEDCGISYYPLVQEETAPEVVSADKAAPALSDEAYDKKYAKQAVTAESEDFL